MLLYSYIISAQLVYPVKIVTDTAFRFSLYIGHDNSYDFVIRRWPLLSLVNDFFVFLAKRSFITGIGGVGIGPAIITAVSITPYPAAIIISYSGLQQAISLYGSYNGSDPGFYRDVFFYHGIFFYYYFF